MIRAYGFSVVGSSHTRKGVGCQDANKICSTENGWMIAAIADGVGSCKYSDIASSIAVDASIRVCLEEVKTNGVQCDLLRVIEKAFTHADAEIDKRSLAEGHLITDYDTTLSLVIYDGKRVTYGHCGDGGIIGLTTNGDYLKITSPQKLEGMYVIPLRSGKDTWVIKQAEGLYASVLLATDGVYDMFFPCLLEGQAVDIHVPLIRYFMDNNLLNVSCKTIQAVRKEREDYINSDACKTITDDKTIVVLINEDIRPALKDKPYYAEPDWEALQLAWDRKAYPHVYPHKEDTTTDVPLKKRHKARRNRLQAMRRRMRKLKKAQIKGKRS